MAANAAHWGEPFLSELERDFELILHDHRGIGRSAPLDRGAITVPGLASDALALLDALEIAAAHVLGISMGGMIAQELALASPGRVRTLIPGARLELLDGAGHLFFWEQPQRSPELVRRFALDGGVLSSA